MARLVLFLTAIWLATAAAQFKTLHSIAMGVKVNVFKGISDIATPIEKTIISVGFSQCTRVKRLLKLDVDSYNKTKPSTNELTLMFITRAVNVTYRLSAAAELIPRSEWFNPELPLKIYLHGFIDDPSQESFTSLNHAFLSQGDLNILALDASSHISQRYLRSTAIVPFIGEELGKLLAALVNAGLDPSNIHLIGHSLGSHISGFAGKTFTSLTGHRLGRITGLDPAGPCFFDVNGTSKLNINDADFVDVIHTDAGVYGLNEQIGHVDFYPNSGSQQPNCLPALALTSCSHNRAWLLFTESVSNPRAFLATSCADWQEFKKGRCNHEDSSLMGFGCRPGTTGTYYLQTAEQAPYGLGPDGIHYQNNEGLLKSFFNKLG